MREELRTIVSLALSRDGFRCILKGAWLRAEALFNQALSLDDDNAYARLGLAEVTACREELAAALPRYREAIERARPEDRGHFWAALAAALVRAGARAREQGDDQQAERYFRSALLFATSDALRFACHEALASLCESAGRPEAAAWHVAQATAILNFLEGKPPLPSNEDYT